MVGCDLLSYKWYSNNLNQTTGLVNFTILSGICIQSEFACRQMVSEHFAKELRKLWVFFFLLFPILSLLTRKLFQFREFSSSSFCPGLSWSLTT